MVHRRRHHLGPYCSCSFEFYVSSWRMMEQLVVWSTEWAGFRLVVCSPYVVVSVAAAEAAVDPPQSTHPVGLDWVDWL